MTFRDVFFFDSMLTPKVITIVYWLALVGIVITGIGAMSFMGFKYMTFGGFLKGVGIIIGGTIAARIWCELMIVLFKLHENVQRIANAKAPQ